MIKEKYTITLDKEIAEEAMRLLEEYGGKKSGILNHMLRKWVRERLEEKKELNEKQKEIMKDLQKNEN